jgi:hypothetical protein
VWCLCRPTETKSRGSLKLPKKKNVVLESIFKDRENLLKTIEVFSLISNGNDSIYPRLLTKKRSAIML